MQHAGRAGDVGKIKQVITNIKDDMKDKRRKRKEEVDKGTAHANKIATQTDDLRSILPDGQEPEQLDAAAVAAWTDEEQQSISFRRVVALLCVAHPGPTGTPTG